MVKLIKEEAKRGIWNRRGGESDCLAERRCEKASKMRKEE